MILCHDNHEMNFALKEVKMLMDLRHNGVIAYRDFFVHKDRWSDLYMCLVMELCEQGDVSKRIRDMKRQGRTFEEGQVLKWAWQLASALEYIHSLGVLHRDLKPTNVFFTTEDDVKIGDFGLSTAINSAGHRTVVGTPYYFAPELMLQQTYDAKVDIWGLGTVLLELCTLKERPLNGQVLHNPDVLDEVEADVFANGYSPTLAGLIKSLLARLPNDRPTAAEALRRLSFVRNTETEKGDATKSNDVAKAIEPDARPPRKVLQSCGLTDIFCNNEGPLPCHPVRARLKNVNAKPLAGVLGVVPKLPITGGALATAAGVFTAANRLMAAQVGKENVPPCNSAVCDVSAKVEPLGPCARVRHVPDSYPSIARALAAAADGDEVIVTAGTYRDPLTISKAVALRGVGEVVIEVTGHTAVVVTASSGRMEDVTVCQLRAPHGAEAKFVGIDIRAGAFTLERCDVSSQSGACIAVHGAGTCPTIRRCTIHGGKQAGVYLFDGAEGLLEDNDIFQNEYAGVLLTRRSNPTLRRNTIRDGRETGVFICHDSTGTLDTNVVRGNRGSGIVVKGGGCPTVIHNTISDNRQAGVFCCDRGDGSFEENDIFGNWKAGVLVKTHANPRLLRNAIHGGREAGVYVFDGGEGLLEDNHIHNNHNAGVLVTTLGRPQLLRNRIERNRYEGVWVCKGGRAHLEGNDLRHNHKGALEIHPDCRAEVSLSANITLDK